MCEIFLYSLFCLFFFFYFLPLFLSLFLRFFSFSRYALIRSAHLTGPAIISLVPTRGTLSRSSWLVCDLIPSVLFLFRSFPISILGSTMRVTWNRNAATKSSIGRICTACTVCISRGNLSRYYGIVLLLFCNRCTMALYSEESIRCIVERRCVHTPPKGASLLVDASRNRCVCSINIISS